MCPHDNLPSSGINTSPITLDSALSSRKAAEFLATTPGVLAVWRSRGDGPPYARIGRKIVYRVRDLNEFLAERVVGAAGGED